MRTRSTDRRAQAAAVAGVPAASPPSDEPQLPASPPAVEPEGFALTPPPRTKAAPAVSGSVRAEMPPELGAERAQKGGSGVTRASELRLSGFEKVVDSLFTFDADATYAEVIQSLEFAGRASTQNYGTLVDALDSAEETARKALQLVANCKVANVNYQTDAAIIEAALRTKAADELVQIHKQDGRKAPTIADIESHMLSIYHDEYSDLKRRITKGKATLEYLEGLAGIAAQRARDLRQMVASVRGT